MRTTCLDPFGQGESFSCLPSLLWRRCRQLKSWRDLIRKDAFASATVLPSPCSNVLVASLQQWGEGLKVESLKLKVLSLGLGR